MPVVQYYMYQSSYANPGTKILFDSGHFNVHSSAEDHLEFAL